MNIYVVITCAREVEGDDIHVMVELASNDKKKVEKFVENRPADDVIVLGGVECLAKRRVIPAILE